MFFLAATPNGVVAGALDSDIQFHDSLLQQLQRPPLAAFGRSGTGCNRDQLRLGAAPSKMRGSAGRGRRMLTRTSTAFETLLPPVADGSVLHRVDAGIQGRRNLAVPSILRRLPRRPSLPTRMRAFVSSRAAIFARMYQPVELLPASSSLSITTCHLFTAICFAVTMHLRHCGAIDSEIHRGINDGGY